jgi:hypothetical protein
MATYMLLTEMEPERFEAVYDALADEVKAALDVPIAKMLNSRMATVRKRPLALRLKALRAYLARKREDDLAMDMLRGYLLGPRKDIVLGFLDGTGVKHEEGEVDEEAEDPDPKKVADTVKALRAEHDAADVKLYLAVAKLQWPDSEAVATALADFD